MFYIPSFLPLPNQNSSASVSTSPLSSWIIHHYTVVFLKIRIVENLYYSIAIGWITRFDLQGDICWKKWHGSDAELADFQKL